jgi:hypothetical protein
MLCFFSEYNWIPEEANGALVYKSFKLEICIYVSCTMGRGACTDTIAGGSGCQYLEKMTRAYATLGPPQRQCSSR